MNKELSKEELLMERRISEFVVIFYSNSLGHKEKKEECRKVITQIISDAKGVKNV